MCRPNWPLGVVSSIPTIEALDAASVGAVALHIPGFARCEPRISPTVPPSHGAPGS